MDTFKQNRIFYIIQIGILLWCLATIFKYKIMVMGAFNIKYVCYAILIYFLHQLIMRLKENEQDSRRIKELDNEFNDFKNDINQQR